MKRWIGIALVLTVVLVLAGCDPAPSEMGGPTGEPVDPPTAEPTEEASLEGMMGEEPTAEPGGEANSEGGEVRDTASLVAALREQGLTVEEGETREVAYFTVPSQDLMVNGELVDVYEFADEGQAQEAAATVGEDGSSFPTMMITWIGPPHWYQQGRLIVLYVGENTNIISALEAILGPQFAGM